MSDWQIGDLAECVHDWEAARDCGIFMGRIYRVVGLVRARAGYSDEGELGLVLEGITVPKELNAAAATRFRRVEPPKQEACEPEFVTLLKRSKRKVAA